MFEGGEFGGDLGDLGMEGVGLCDGGVPLFGGRDDGEVVFVHFLMMRASLILMRARRSMSETA